MITGKYGPIDVALNGGVWSCEDTNSRIVLEGITREFMLSDSAVNYTDSRLWDFVSGKIFLAGKEETGQIPETPATERARPRVF